MFPAATLRFVRLAGAFSVLVGLVVLAGWALDLPLVKSVVAGATSMRVNSALSFVALGIGLWLVSGGRSGERAYLAGRVFGVGVATLGILTVVEYLAGVNLGIDEVLFIDRDTIATSNPGRMSPLTAFGFVAAGAALAFIDARPRRVRSAQALAVFPALIGYLGVVGYAFEVSGALRVGSFSAIAIHTSVTMLVVSVGILIARPDRGLGRLLSDPGPGPLLIRRVLPAIVVLIPAVAFVRLAAERSGLISTEVGLAAMAFVTIGITSLIVLSSARALDAIDAARRETLARLEDFFALSADMLVSADGEGRFTRVSEASRRIVGWAPAELIGRPYIEFVHPDDRERTSEEFRRAYAGRQVAFDFGNRFLHADGGFSSVESTGTFDAKTGLVHAVVRDISERKAAEAALAAARAEVDRARLAKRDVLSSMSHELRTPLNAILGFGQLLETSDLPGPDRESVTEILRAGRHLLGLIDEVLEFSRIDAGRISLSIEPVALGPLLREALDLSRPLAAEHGLSIVEEPPADPPIVVLADAQRLGQVLLNLLSNAAKFNRPGGSITVAGFSSAERAGVTVSDSGIGIEADRLERLFEPSETPPGGPTARRWGLGLTLSARLVQLMNGSLTVTSELGVGSTFTIELPLAPRRPAPDWNASHTG